MEFKKMLLFIWNTFFDIQKICLNELFSIRDSLVRPFLKPPKIKSINDTLHEIIVNKASVSRYGDGEFKLINERDITFQKGNPELCQRLINVLQVEDQNFLVCLPDVFEDLSQYIEEPRTYWYHHISRYRLQWYRLIKPNKTYYNSFISRCYYAYKDKSNCYEQFSLIKQIWNKRDVLLIEGRKSRLGIGNDLFDNVGTMERILVPEENAFSQYDRIINEAKKYHKSKLILLAIGPTATVLAYDLFKEGYQTIDIGHIDIEYEWFLRHAKTKISIENKYVCEAGAGQNVGDLRDEKYLSEVKAVLT